MTQARPSLLYCLSVCMEKANTRTEFDAIRTIGQGTFGKVLLTRHRSSGTLSALKQLSKTHIFHAEQTGNVMNERRILKSLSCPFITQLYSTFQDAEFLYFSLEVRFASAALAAIHGHARVGGE